MTGSSQFVRGSRQRHREGRVDDVSGIGLQTREMERAELVSLGRLPGREEENHNHPPPPAGFYRASTPGLTQEGHSLSTGDYSPSSK